MDIKEEASNVQSKERAALTVGSLVIFFAGLISGLILFFGVFKYGHFSFDFKTKGEMPVERQLELSKMGYVRTLIGTVTEMDAKKKFIVVKSDVSGSPKDYKIYIDRDTEFLSIINNQEPVETEEENKDKERPDGESKIINTSFDDIIKDKLISINFSERIDVEKEEKLIAQQILIEK